MNDAEPDKKYPVNLPRTDFPMQANLAKREPEMLARWQAEGLYQQVLDASVGGERFWFVDGPPYANGDIHIGHAVNKVLKDIVVKAARLDGHWAPFIPGWDCHGLPIELQVEKKFGKVGEKLDAASFRRHCRAYAAEQVERQKLDFQRLGILADWDRPYLTMQPAYEAEQLRVLARIIDNGHVVPGAKPVHWCLDCGSSLAEAEVEYQDKTSWAIDVRFAAADPVDLAARFGLTQAEAADFVIWTTTPWTLPANQAIAISPALNYVLARFPGLGTVVVASELLDSVASRVGETATVLAQALGRDLEGAQARHPFAERVVPLVLGDHVTVDAGTGLVHTAPAHGVEDFEVGRLYGLTVDNPVLGSGVFIPGTPLVAGQHVRKVDEPIIEALRGSGRLLHAEKFQHSYPHCWRHKSALIFRATRQWFISMETAGLRKKALAEIDATQFFPESGRNRIREMVAGRPDWCISRQRYWGVPLAIFVDRNTQQLHPQAADLLRRVADRVAEQGLEAWFGSQPADWGVDEAGYEKCTDTLDVWFDSGSAHQCVFKATQPQTLDSRGLAPRADIYLEGSDQHRGWFQSSLLTCTAMRGAGPYRSVLTHGFTVDENGRKMSKSLGNVVAPQEVIKTYGADVLRLWVASADYRGEIKIWPELIKRIAESYRRIRNTLRYLLGNLEGFEPERDALPTAELLALDRWALTRAKHVQGFIQQGYRQRDFFLAVTEIHDFCNLDLSSLYLDVLKDRLYTTPARSLPRRSAQTVLWHLAETLVRWIAPVLSFTADEVWRSLPGARPGPVFAQGWYPIPEPTSADLDWKTLLELRTAVKKVLEDLRIRGEIGSSLNARVSLYAEGALLEALKPLEAELRFWLITSEAQVQSAQARDESAQAATLESGTCLWIAASASPHSKCPRCWHQRAELGCDTRHPTLCPRCAGNVEGEAEPRLYF